MALLVVKVCGITVLDMTGTVKIMKECVLLKKIFSAQLLSANFYAFSWINVIYFEYLMFLFAIYGKIMFLSAITLQNASLK